MEFIIWVVGGALLYKWLFAENNVCCKCDCDEDDYDDY